MRVLTESEAQEFALRHGLTFEDLDPGLSRTESTTDVGRRCYLSNALTQLIVTEPHSVACLDITDWAVWPSAQNMDLFYSYRRSLGEQRPLSDAHFHVFTAAEANECRNILHLALISLFDVAGASTTTDFRFYASHDEWIDFAWFEGASWQEQVRVRLGVDRQS